jgi:hypothetical protein
VSVLSRHSQSKRVALLGVIFDTKRIFVRIRSRLGVACQQCPAHAPPGQRTTFRLLDRHCLAIVRDPPHSGIYAVGCDRDCCNGFIAC